MQFEIQQKFLRSNLIPAAFGILLFIAYFLFSYWILNNGHPHEDAYILFIFAENLANGNGIVYNASGEHTEGATDFLWMLILAGAVKLGMNTALAAAMFNGLGMGLIAFLITKALGFDTKKINASKLAITLLFLVLLACSELTAASMAGFSVAFYTAISTLTLYLYIHNNKELKLWIPPLCLILALI